MNYGKDICNELKSIRKGIAQENGIPLEIPECTYKGDCDGTCPRCEAELQYLERELTMRAAMGKVAVVAGLALGLTGGTLTAAAQNVEPEKQKTTSLASNSQVTADSCLLRSTVISSTNQESVPFANVVLKKDGQIVTGTNCDFNGNFSLRVPKGTYQLEISSIGYMTHRTTLDLNTDSLSIGSFVLVQSGGVLGGIPVMVGMPKGKTPLIEIGVPESGERIDADRIKHFPN